MADRACEPRGAATSLVVHPFDPALADVVAGWVGSTRELRQLAPSTPWPLTAEKIRAWPKGGGSAFLGFVDRRETPVTYGELNPMRHDRDHYWLGHVIVDPAYRGAGLGRRFVGSLLDEAFADRGASRVSLVVFPDNTAAIRCYEGAGFRLAGEERHRFGHGGAMCTLLRYEARNRLDPAVSLLGRFGEQFLPEMIDE